jgi:hypothetical protein
VTTNRGGRPTLGRSATVTISVKLPADLIARLDARAGEVGDSRSGLLRRGAEQLLARDGGLTTAVARVGQFRPAVGDRVSLWRRTQVGRSGVHTDWLIGPAADATDGPTGPAWGDPAGFSVQTVGWGTGVVVDVYPDRDLPVYLVEPAAG